MDAPRTPWGDDLGSAQAKGWGEKGTSQIASEMLVVEASLP